jgi:alpha-N-arabinofuranosidase
VWGARRAKDGHPAPFQLEYVEIGNEDNFDREVGGGYEGRFSQFYDAIRAKYPALKIISSTRASSRVPDVLDEHLYPRTQEDMVSRSHSFDARPRTGPKIFVGEWATRAGEPTPNMSAALGDSCWMTNMERNTDLVIMGSYAPLFVNVNPGGMQWKTDLIGYNALGSYGSPAYYAQKMFSNYHGDVVLPVTAEGIPTRTWQPPTPQRRPPAPGAPAPAPPAPPAPQELATIFWSATRDTKTGMIFLKVVNRASTAQAVRVEFSGLTSVEPRGQAVTLSSNSQEDTNSITEPTKIVPVTSTVDGLGASFTRNFPPNSLTVLQMKAK